MRKFDAPRNCRLGAGLRSQKARKLRESSFDTEARIVMLRPYRSRSKRGVLHRRRRARALGAAGPARPRGRAARARLQSTARQGLANATGSNDPGNTAAGASGTACPSGYCYLDYAHPIPFAQAYGAGLVDAAAVVG
jgi:hypothetical protein